MVYLINWGDCDMIVYKKRTMQGYADGIWSVNYMMSDYVIKFALNSLVNLREIDNFMDLPNLIDFKTGKIPGYMLHTLLFNRGKHPDFRLEKAVCGAKVLADELSMFFNEIESTLNDELKKNKPDYYAIRFIDGLNEYADRYKKYAKILTLLEELIYYHQTGKNPYTKLADGRLYRYSMMPRAHELLNNWVCKLLKVVMYYYQNNVVEEKQNFTLEPQLEYSEGQQNLKDILPDRLKGDEAVGIFKKAIEAGLINQDGFKWTNTKQLLAYFAMKLSDKFSLSNMLNRDGKKTTAWKPFEKLFGETGLSSAKSNWMRVNTEFEPTGFEKVDALFA